MSFKPLTALLGVLALAYPLLVWFGLDLAGPKFLGLLLAGLAVARALIIRQPFWWGAAGAASVLAVLAFFGNALMPLKLYPVLVNLLFLGVFGISLWHPPTAIERIARLTEPDFPEAAVAYTRRVTQVWCGFFVFNGSLALVTALWASTATWALYNGLLSYLLMGNLLGAEWLVRRRVKARVRAQERSLVHG